MTISASERTELADARTRFGGLLDPDAINARQPMGPGTVYTPWVVVFLLVYQRLHANAPLSDAVAELLRSTHLLPPNRRVDEGTLSANTGAYSSARTRLRVEVTEAVADAVFGTLVAAAPPSFGDRRAFLVDGTTVALPPGAELLAAFPPADLGANTSAWPVWHWVVAHELASGCAMRPETGAMYGPTAVSELTLATRLLPRVPARSILLADRNFGVFAFAYAATHAEHDVLLRLTGPRFRALVKGAQPAGAGQWKRCWKPSRGERKKYPHLPAEAHVEVRLHEIVVSPALTLWLVTTLRNTGTELAALYGRRQDVETDIRDVKRTLPFAALRGRSVAMVGKELAAGLVAYNLVVQVRRLAAARAGVAPRRLSFAGVWSLVKVVLLSPNAWSVSEWQAKFEWVLRGAAQRKIPERPGRSYPRTVIRRARTFPNRPRPPVPPDTK